MFQKMYPFLILKLYKTNMIKYDVVNNILGERKFI